MIDIDEKDTMRDEYDFDKMKARRNPYAAKLKKQVTLDIPDSTIDYFTKEAKKKGVSFQNLMGVYLIDCANQKRHI